MLDTKKPINVLSLFDGISCGRIALERAGINVNRYYSSEIDKYAINISKHNYPKIKRLGDVKEWKEWDINWSDIDLIIGGSPCQGFSFAGKQLAFEDPRSKLFFEFVNILNHTKSHNPNVKFLLENVRMKKQYLDVITEMVGVEPKFINSALVSAQNRQRFYWANWNFPEPKDKGITWGDIKENNVNTEKYYYTEKAMQWLGRHSRKNNKILRVFTDDEKMQMVEASHHKKYSSQRFFGVIDYPSSEQAIASMRGRRIDPLTMKRVDERKDIPVEQHVEFRYDGKSNCLSTVAKDNIVVPFTLPNRIPLSKFFFRYVIPLECERLQTIPDGYTKIVSDSQRYKALGNGWTVDVIAHIFGYLKLT